ncbi:MAG: hypothetical protein AAFX99_09380, partial [Myxococcota bacterium]
MNHTPHNLRTVLVWNGTVFQEKTFNRVSGDTISVGESHVNDFTVPADGLPETFEMFKRTNGGYIFRLTGALSGKVHINNENRTVEELTQTRGMAKVGSALSATGTSVNIYEGSLSPGDWGVIQLGAVSIFFQFVDSDAAVLHRPPFNRDTMQWTRRAKNIAPETTIVSRLGRDSARGRVDLLPVRGQRCGCAS